MRPRASRFTKTHRNIRPMRLALIVSGVCAALSIAACNSGDPAREGASAPSTIPQPTRAQLVAAGLDKLPLAPESKRLDITAPTFSNPTKITNPLFPVIVCGR